MNYPQPISNWRRFHSPETVNNRALRSCGGGWGALLGHFAALSTRFKSLRPSSLKPDRERAKSHEPMREIVKPVRAESIETGNWFSLPVSILLGRPAVQMLRWFGANGARHD